MPKISTQDGKFCQQVPHGSEWLQVAEYYPNLPIRFGCRHGDCGTCAIRIVKGMDFLTRCGKQELSTLQRKKLSSDCRLACQCAINGDITFSQP